MPPLFLQTSVVLFYNKQDSLSDQNAWDSATITIQNTVRTISTDTRAQQYVSLSIRSYSLGVTHCVAIYRLTTYDSTSEPWGKVHGVSARLWERRGRVKDTCSAAMLEHVTLPYCRDLRSAGTYVLNAHRFSFHLHGWHTHTPMNQHIHTSHVTLIHTLSTILSPCCTPCKLLCATWIHS